MEIADMLRLVFAFVRWGAIIIWQQIVVRFETIDSVFACIYSCIFFCRCCSSSHHLHLIAHVPAVAYLKQEQSAHGRGKQL